MSAELLKLENLSKTFRVETGFLGTRHRSLRAVDGVTLGVAQHQVLGLVGESGCGKSTLARAALWLDPPTSGRVSFAGQDLGSLGRNDLKALRREMQIIFQDPVTSLNPRLSVGSILGEPLVIHGLAKRGELKDRVAEMLAEVGLRPEHAQRYPHQFSGGQRQRIGIARALALRPSLVVADEPVSALDVSIQAQVLNLLLDLKEKRGLTYLFVAHDLSVVRHVSDRVAVMYLGQVVEVSPAGAFGDQASHPYGLALAQAAPVADPHRKFQEPPVHGDPPSPLDPPAGCRFHTRCPEMNPDICPRVQPPLEEKSPGRLVACHLR